MSGTTHHSYVAVYVIFQNTGHNDGVHHTNVYHALVGVGHVYIGVSPYGVVDVSNTVQS